jgi:hypothetical protein
MPQDERNWSGDPWPRPLRLDASGGHPGTNTTRHGAYHHLRHGAPRSGFRLAVEPQRTVIVVTARNHVARKSTHALDMRQRMCDYICTR